MKTFLVALIMLFAAGAQADTTAKIDKILMYEGGNLVYFYPVGGGSFGVRSCFLPY
jgi:hypothetical protein